MKARPAKRPEIAFISEQSARKIEDNRRAEFDFIYEAWSERTGGERV